MRRVNVAITMGDPAGIGPEVVADALKTMDRAPEAVFFVMGDSSVLGRYGFVERPDVRLIDLKTLPARGWRPGAANKKTARSSIAYLQEAVGWIRRGACDALVTAPIAKESVREVGFSWPGHTEFLAAAFGAKNVEMVFVGDHLKVALVTRHMALKKVVDAVTRPRIVACGTTVFELCRKFFVLRNPRIAVLGLNPHAGEAGMFGSEERQIIQPAIRTLNKKLGNCFFGPWPADTVFTQAMSGAFDMVVAMYHDQGLVAFKTVDFSSGIQLTAGLGFVRTSPVHGTAYDIAGRRLADSRSMRSAIEWAVRLAKNSLR